MKTNVKNNLIKIAIAMLSICLLGALLFGFKTQNVKAIQAPVFEIENGAYIRELDADFADNTAIRFTVKLTDSWVEQNLSGVEGEDYRFYSKVTLNGKTLYKGWSAFFDENGVFYRNVDLANFPSEEQVSDIYSYEFTVAFGVTSVEDLEDGVVTSSIYETNSVTRTMEYVAAKALANGGSDVSEYIGGGNALVNKKDNVLEVMGVNTSPNKVLDFDGYDGSDVKSFYINGVKQQNSDTLTETILGVEVEATDYTFGEDYSYVMITNSGDALIADRVTFADYAISDIDSYLEWYNAGASTSIEYYVALSNNVYLTEKERVNSQPSKFLGNGCLDGRGYVLDGLSNAYTGIWKDIGEFTFKNVALTNMSREDSKCAYAALFAYNDAVNLTFDNVYLSYTNVYSDPTEGRVGFTSLSSTSTDKNVHFYNSVIVANQPNTSLPLFKKGVVGTLSNTKVISLQNRDVTTGVKADYISLDAYNADTTMSTSGYDMQYWKVVNGVLMFKSLIAQDIVLEDTTLGKNLSEDEVCIPIESSYKIEEITIDGEITGDYYLSNCELVIYGFLEMPVGEYVVNVIIVDGSNTYTYVKKAIVVENRIPEQIVLQEATLYRNHLEDSISETIDEKYKIQKVTLDGEAVDYTLANGVLVVSGFAQREYGTYTLNILVKEGARIYYLLTKTVIVAYAAPVEIVLQEVELGKNLLEDTVSVAIDERYQVQEVTLDSEVVDYTFTNGNVVVSGFASRAVGVYTLKVLVSEGVYEYILSTKVTIINNKTATDAHYNGYILLDGVTKHKLIVPSSTDTYSAKAIEDFKTLFNEATGVSISSTTDKSTISYSESSRYIVLGGSYIYDKAGLTVDESVEQDGYQIVTKGQSIFILGTTTRGKLFGAYELLSRLFNYERFSPETYTIDTDVRYKALPLFDFIDNPDAELRIGGWGSVYYNSEETAALTMRFDMNYKDLWVEDTVYGANWTHNIAEIMDYVGHIPSDRSKIVDNFGNKFDVDTTVSGWYNNYTMTYSYKDPLNKTGTRWGYDVNGDYRRSYGVKVGWFSVAATSSTMASKGDPLACTSNNDPVINKAVQLCYSGGTYPTDTKHEVWQEMVEFGAQRVADIINAYTGKNKIFQITAEDNANYCQCKACRAWYDYYSKGNLYLHEYINTANVVMSKGLMGLQLRFVNALAKYITEHDLLDADKKDVKIACFCYSNYTDAPCIEQADGTFKPIDDAVICPDNVLIYYAPSMDYTKDLTDETSETNVKMLKIFKANSVICDHIGAWLYQMSDYDDYFLPSNNYYAYSDIYETLVDMGAKWIFHQGAQKRTTRNTAFAQLKLYLNSKLQWDTSLDEQELIDKFFDGYFGPASQTMQDFFYDVYNVVDANGGTTTLSRDVFSQSDLEYWIELCEQALEDIKPLKTTDSARYNLLVQNINCEMMMPRYLLIRLYSIYKGSSITNLSTVKTQFIAECRAAGVLQGTDQDVIANVNLNPVS